MATMIDGITIIDMMMLFTITMKKLSTTDTFEATMIFFALFNSVWIFLII